MRPTSAAPLPASRSVARAFSLAVLGLAFAGCASPAAREARSPDRADSQAGDTDQDEPRAAREPLVLPAPHPAVPAVPEQCAPLIASAAATAPACTVKSLAGALAQDEPRARDGALAALESCSEWPRGLVRALRTELAPAECGDALVDEHLQSEAGASDAGAAEAGTEVELQETLFALGLGARLRRLAQEPPPPPSVHDKPSLEGYFRDTLFPWITRQSQAIQQLAERGARLRGYARAVVAVEAGMADMRFVEIARAVPIPREMRDDAELRDTYYASLDEALEPRKQRGRDAALAGLRELDAVGVLVDERLAAARGLLSRVYGGRRIDALDRLFLPPLPAPSETAASAAPEAQLAAHLPSFYAPWLLSGAETDVALLRAYLQRGVPRSVRADLGSKRLAEPEALLLARARIELGRAYFGAEHFAAAQKLTADRDGEEARFLSALATALVAGPRNAVELIARGPRFAEALGNLEPLDRIADGNGPWAPLARYDATYLRELVAPVGDAAYWEKLAAGYERAARGLTGPPQTEARARAEAARATARTLEREARTGR